MTATTLLLVRHGESVATVTQMIAGEVADRGLSDLGRRQAEALRDRFASGSEPRVDSLWSSTLPRARETAEIVAEALDLAVSVDAELVEHRPGEADGVRFRDYPGRFGAFDMNAEPFRPLAPGGESLAGFRHRALAALYRLVDAHAGQTILVACHGGVIDAAFRGLLALPSTGIFDLWTLNASITELVRLDDAGQPTGRWQLKRYNDAAHLAGLPTRTEPTT